jgi:NAD(P)-dependent dehydrogenase (short-subunit alcohol dehydrogenase family)
MGVAGKQVAITGAAGGLGRAIGAALAEGGAEVWAFDRGEASTGRQGDLVRTSPMDVTDPEQVASGFAAVEPARLDALVVAAGIQLHGQDGPAGDVDLDVWNETLQVNLTGAFLVIKYALPLLLAAERSSIVLIGSPTGLTMSGAGYTAYSASKAGMMALARTVAADYAPRVRANVVVPGTMRTPLTEPLLTDADIHAELLAGLPAGRLGEPADLTGLVTWLVSDQSSFATGAFFAVDGGLTAR